MKSTLWTIGHEHFGIRGDSRARILNYHKNDSGDSWFDLFGDSPELLKEDKVIGIIQDLTSKNK